MLITNNNHKEEKRKSFVAGVLLLSASTILVKIIGLFYKIPMLSLLGAEGMGYFNSSYEIFAVLCIVATTGLPVAISMLVSSSMVKADGREEKNKIFRCAMRIAIALGVLGSLSLFFFGKEISTALGNQNAAECIVAISPSLLFVCICGVYRGYFQGLGCMYPTAVSQVIEVFGKLIFGVMFSAVAIKRGADITTAAALATTGLSLGMLFSMIYLALQKKLKDRSEIYKNSRLSLKSEYYSRIIKIAVPITLGSVVVGITRIIDMILIFKRLEDVGVDAVEANVMYGAYTTLAVPIFSLIPSLIAPISLALVPALSSAIKRRAQKEQSYVAQNSLKMTALFAIPASFGISVFSKPILCILFSNQMDAVELVSPLLSVLGASIFFSCIITTSNAILHAYVKTGIPIISMGSGALVKLVSEYLLIGISDIGIFGAPISTLLCDITVSVINLWAIIRLIPESKGMVGSLWRILVASAGAVLSAVGVYIVVIDKLHNELFAVASAAGGAALSYIVLVFLIKALTLEDISSLPMGEKILSLFSKIKV